MIQFDEAEKILKKLPVAYYLKRKLDVKLDYAKTSCIDIFNDRLIVSYNQLAELNAADEKDVRCCLYHEVSHAFLTPLRLNMTDIVNIFEDERIETICKHYYFDVDFKSFVFKTNNYNGQAPQSARQLFYYVVRYRLGPSRFVSKVSELIKKHKSLNRDSSNSDCKAYFDDIYEFYREVESYWNANQIKKESNSNPEVCNANEENASQSISDKIAEKDDEEDEKRAIINAIESLNKQFNSLNDESFQEKIDQILFAKSKSVKMNGSAINAYSGVFDCRSTIRQDYKYFIQKNRAGNVKRFSKVKLNLFIDDSGSFGNSEAIVNKMLYNLAKLEKKTPDFEFDVIVMDIGEKLLKKDERKLKCDSCNLLNKDIFNLFSKVQKQDAANINIVLFDGNAFSCLKYQYCSSDFKNLVKEYECNFAAFNKSNTIIISDYENEQYIEEYCKSAKKIFVCSDYAKTLIKNVTDSLEHCLR